jgi:AcrR family transcriptional regulator
MPDENATSDMTLGRRRTPGQQRSKDRMERILSAASELIGAKGGDQVRMTEIAARAGTSIGSLYQYFPEKSAIIHALAARYNAASRECIDAALLNVQTVAELQTGFATLMDQYYAMIVAEPVSRDIWSAMQSDKQLAATNAEENRTSVQLLTHAITRIHPGADHDRIAIIAELIWTLGEAALRLAIVQGPEIGQETMAAFKRIAARELALK